jgi:hypothetical protein
MNKAIIALMLKNNKRQVLNDDFLDGYALFLLTKCYMVKIEARSIEDSIRIFSVILKPWFSWFCFQQTMVSVVS